MVLYPVAALLCRFKIKFIAYLIICVVRGQEVFRIIFSELTLLPEQGDSCTTGATSSRDGFGTLGRGGRIVLSIDVTGAMLNCGDNRFDDHRVGSSFRGIADVLQIFDVGRIKGGYIGGFGRGGYVIRVRT